MFGRYAPLWLVWDVVTASEVRLSSPGSGYLALEGSPLAPRCCEVPKLLSMEPEMFGSQIDHMFQSP